jgi:predicted DNA-binding transcriptional regulator YafY
VELLPKPGTARLPAGWQRAKIQFEGEAEALSVALGLGSKAIVLEPAALRRSVLAEARGLISRHQRLNG